MMHQALLSAQQGPTCTLDLRRRRNLALVVTSTSAMLASLAVGYALGVQQSFQRTLTRGNDNGV